MPAPVESELPFNARMQTRERILAWISRDVGLSEFLIPDALAVTWTGEQREVWTSAVIEKFLHVEAGQSGQLARNRVLACETAGSLRRSCMQLRQRTATHRDVMKTSVALEALWNSASPLLDDRTWATCSLLFDTALIALRVSYLWMYLKAEASGPQASLDTRKSLFVETVNFFFTSEAPTDDSEDKHSDNFKKLLEVWHQELEEYASGDEFEERMSDLEKTQSLGETASCVQKFVTSVNVDDSWVLRMLNVERLMKKGALRPKPKGRRKGPQKSNGKPSQPVAAANGDSYESPSPSVSSMEPRAPDSDFDIKDAEEDDQDDEDSGSAANEQLPAIRSKRILGSYNSRTRGGPTGEARTLVVTPDTVMKAETDKWQYSERRSAKERTDPRIHRSSVFEEEEPQTPERSAVQRGGKVRRSNRNMVAARLADVEDAIGLDDSPRITRGAQRGRDMKPVAIDSPYAEPVRRSLRSQEVPQEGPTRGRRALRRTHADMMEDEGRGIGSVRETINVLGSRESRRRLVETALRVDDQEMRRQMAAQPDIRRSPRRTRK